MTEIEQRDDPRRAREPGDGSPAAGPLIIQQLETLILKGELASGARLPPERDLMHMFGVSRTVVREAIAGLAAKRVQRHVIVRLADNWSKPQPCLQQPSAGKNGELSLTFRQAARCILGRQIDRLSPVRIKSTISITRGWLSYCPATSLSRSANVPSVMNNAR